MLGRTTLFAMTLATVGCGGLPSAGEATQKSLGAGSGSSSGSGSATGSGSGSATGSGSGSSSGSNSGSGSSPTTDATTGIPYTGAYQGTWLLSEAAITGSVGAQPSYANTFLQLNRDLTAAVWHTVSPTEPKNGDVAPIPADAKSGTYTATKGEDADHWTVQFALTKPTLNGVSAMVVITAKDPAAPAMLLTPSDPAPFGISAAASFKLLDAPTADATAPALCQLPKPSAEVICFNLRCNNSADRFEWVSAADAIKSVDACKPCPNC